MKATRLTDRQREVLEKIREYVARYGVPPSRTELAQSVGLTFPTAVKTHLEALKRKGWIELKPGMDRGIVLLREGTPVFDVSTLPTVPAGAPALADETAAAFRVPGQLSKRIHPQADFYVILNGDSMDQVGYRSGDIVAVKRNPDPGEGEVVIARIGQEITLKCFHRAGRNRIEAAAAQQQPRAQADRDRRSDPRLGDRRGRRRGDDRRAADGRMLTDRAPTTMSTETLSHKRPTPVTPDIRR